MPTLITEANLGAWLIKCDPVASPDVPRMIEEPGPSRVTRWCVARNYRSRLMRPGQRAILWVSGNGRRLTRGIWGLGWVAGDVPDGAPDVALDVPLLRPGQEIAAADLVAAGITDLEVQRQAQGSNPSWVSKDQLAAIERALGGWPTDTWA